MTNPEAEKDITVTDAETAVQETVTSEKELQEKLEQALNKLDPETSAKAKKVIDNSILGQKKKIAAKTNYIADLERVRKSEGSITDIKVKKPEVKLGAISPAAIIKGLAIAAEVLPVILGILKSLKGIYDKHIKDKDDKIHDMENEIMKRESEKGEADKIRKMLKTG